MSCVSQSITRYSLIRCIVSSAQFARGELCFYESHAELLAQDAAGETTTPLRIDYDALLHFRVVRQEQLMRIEVPYRVVQRWADANGFAAELCSGGGAQPSPDAPCALIEQLSAEDMTHFLQCVAPVVAASRRARSASRVSTTEPLPLSYFPPSPQDNNNNNNNNTAETAEEPNEEYQEYKEEEKEEQEEEEEEEQHEEESREGEKSEAGDEKSERLSRCLEHIAADHTVHLSRDCTTQVRSAHCSASSATSSSQCSAARQRPPRSRAAVRAKRQRPLLGTSSDGEPSPAKQSKAESQSASVAVPPMPLPMPMPMPSAKPRRVGAMVKAKPKVPCAPLGPTNALYNFADVMTAPENAAILRPCGAEVKKMLVDLQEILPCRRRTGAVARERQLQAKKSVKTPLPKAEVHSTDKPPVVENSVVAENTRPANSVVAENTRPANSVVADNTRPANSVVAENTRPDNSVVAENTRPDNSVVAENTRPDNSVVAENTRPDNSVVAENTRPANSVVAENTRPDNSVVAENTRPDNSVVAENTRPANSVVADNTRPANSVVAENTRPANSVVAENTRPDNSVVAENIRTDELMSAPVEEPTTPLLNTRAFHDSRRAALAAERRAARKAKRAPKSKAPAPATAAIVPLRAASECPAAALPGLREVTPPSSSQCYGCEHCGYAAMGHSVSDERKDRWRRVVRHLDGITAHLTRARACGEELRGLFLVMLEDSEI